MNKVIDLFSGCGGFSVGFEKAGFNITKAVEYDKQISYSYKMNHKNTEMLNCDISTIDNENYFTKNEADVIIGGPPCQGFSMAGARIRGTFIDDPRNYLFKHYLNIVKIVKPKVFIIENVKGILTMENGKIFDEIVKSFKNKDNFNGDYYHVEHRIVKCSEFGIPQKRERVIIIGVLNKTIDIGEIINIVRNKVEIKHPTFFDKVSVWDAIGNLPVAVSEGTVNNPSPLNVYQKYLSSQNIDIYNHNFHKHNSKSIERMQKINAGENYEVLDEHINSVHSGSYGRLSKDDVASTITTRFDTPSGGRFIHPIENRTITPREAARIQSFPDDFIFYGSKSIICRQIGNAVPPKVAYFFANVVREILNEYYK